MTDISDWQSLVQVVRVRGRDVITNQYERDYFAEYTVIPLNPYQMGNLLDALLQVPNTGDWYGEFCNIIAVAMEKAALKELTSNRGTRFTLEDVRSNLYRLRQNPA